MFLLALLRVILNVVQNKARNGKNPASNVVVKTNELN